MKVITENKLFVEVGSSCISDFLGGVSVDSILFQANFLSSIDEILSEGKEFGCRVNPVYRLEYILACTIKSVSDYGYVSSKMAIEQERCSTSGEVAYMMNGNRQMGIAPYAPTEAEYTEARNIIEWMKENVKADNDYLYNLVKIVENDACTHKYLGFAVSMVPFYRKQMDLIRASEAKKASEYFGNVGDKTQLELKYVNCYTFQSFYGFVNIHRFVDSNDNIFVWKSANTIDIDFGVTVSIKCTIKAHSEYKNIKQTELTRCKVSEKK